MTAIWRRLWVCLTLSLSPAITLAHESRPAYLEISEIAPARYSVLWRTPVNSGVLLPVRLTLPDCSRDLSPPAVRDLADSRIERRVITCPSGLAGKRIDFVGLQNTITDVLVRVQLLEGAQSTTLVHPSSASVQIPAASSLTDVARAYVAYGFDHILGGMDHLLFLLGLLLIVRGKRRIVATVTAFTVAHSLTLAAATLGWVHVPQALVEAVIALSIIFVAVEVVRGLRGSPGITARAPWLAAFCFGLLHGFGFAGALAEVGLPANAIPTALLLFNVGVELGQLAFVAVVMIAIALLKRLRLTPQHWTRWIPPYVIGGIASFWMWQRIETFWT
jgi:hydrogenase/urease accessory protein HupE